MVVYRHAPGAYRHVISLFLDIGQGAGLAGATGVRPFLPPLLTGALARADAGIDFDGTAYEFLERPGFLLAVLAVAVGSYVAERSAPNGAAPSGRRNPLPVLVAVVALVLGALLFAGSLASGDHRAWPGLVAGALCAGAGYLALTALFDRARRRLARSGSDSAASLLPVYADAVALGLAGLAIFLEPIGYAALIAFGVLLLAGRRESGRKYAGLRILR